MTDHDLADHLHRLADDLGLQGYAPMGATGEEGLIAVTETPEQLMQQL